MRGNLKLFELKSGRGEKLMKNILIPQGAWGE